MTTLQPWEGMHDVRVAATKGKKQMRKEKDTHIPNSSLIIFFISYNSVSSNLVLLPN